MDQQIQDEIFADNRTRLRAVAYRLLGSVPDADDAVQEAWLRMHRADVSEVGNLAGWLTTVVSRICLDQLRSRAVRREDSSGQTLLADDQLDSALAAELDSPTTDPAAEVEQADAVGRALQVVLDTLPPAERLAFCLHDLFGLSFSEIAVSLGRSSAACRQLASRARRRVRGQTESIEVDRVRQQEVVGAFLDASRNGRFERLLELLHPGAVVTSDAAAAAMGSPALLAGRDEIAAFFNGAAKAARPALLDGLAAAKWTLRGELKVVFAFTVTDGQIVGIEFLADDLDRLDLG